MTIQFGTDDVLAIQRRGRMMLSRGTAPALMVSLIIAAPLVAIFSFAGVSTQGLWQHLASTVLGDYIINSVILTLSVALISAALGTGSAWLITMCRFPGRDILSWGLVLPLAMPAYVLAYGYTDLLQSTGLVQSWLRSITGWQWGDYWFPDIRSLGGAVFVLSAALYPYVYVTARAAFIEQSVCALEVSRTLGCRPIAMFYRVALPLARPAIVAGSAFVAMETLADFGAVKFFELPTFTTGIYRAWFADGSPAAASQLASILLGSVFLVLTIERLSRGHRRVAQSSGKYRPIHPFGLRGTRAVGASIFCFMPVLIGFLLPAIALLLMIFHDDAALTPMRLARLAGHSITIGCLAAVCVTGVALFVSYQLRRGTHGLGLVLARVASLGYATPGIVIGIGILIVLGAVDHALSQSVKILFGSTTGLILGGSLFAVLYGCLVRFFASGYAPLESSLGRIRPTLEDAARTLGTGPRHVFARVHLPMIRGSVLSALLLVFVDVMKELPVTMILRPFNFDTLATEAFQLASTERLAASALPSLIIVAAGLVPVILICREIGRARVGQHQAPALESVLS